MSVTRYAKCGDIAGRVWRQGRAALGGVAALWLVLTVQALAGSGPIPGGVRLVMVETASCVYCIRWHREIGPSYPLSPQGLMAPLVRREIGDPSLSGLAKVVYTPTFILVRDGEEVARLTGYPGREHFWSEIDALLAQLGPAPGQPPGVRGERFTYDHGRASTCRAVPC